ncbi:hypothetical protein T08_7424 [Trichinella sp. T8]|nr:hypothetical protein T08_7424 [Trichinella sp. T8]
MADSTAPTASSLASTSRRKVRSKSGWPRIGGLTSAFFRRCMQRVRHACKIPDEPSIIGRQPQELPDLPHASGRGPLLDSCCLLWVGTNPLLRYDVAQVLLFCLPEDDDVVEIDEARLPRQSPQRFFHQPLKRRWGVAQPERHDAELEEPQRCGERCLLPVFFCDFDLPVAGR